MIRIITILLTLFILAGCATHPKEIVVVKTKTVFIKIPNGLLVRCIISVPPPKDIYINSTAREKEDLLTAYILTLIKDSSSCMSKIDAIANWDIRQQDIYIKKE